MKQLRRAFLWALISSLAASGLLATLAIVVDVGSSDELLGITLVVAGFSLLAMVLAAVLERGHLAWLMWIGMATNLLAALCWCILIWTSNVWWGPATEALVRTALAMTAITFTVAHTGLLRLPVVRSSLVNLVRVVPIVLAWILCAIAVLTCLDDQLMEWIAEAISEELVFRTIAVMFTLMATLTAIAPVLMWVTRSRELASHDGLGEDVLVEARCPRCLAVAERALGRSRCPGCGLVMTIAIDEPRCMCGYLLYGVEAPACPECGRNLPADTRWPRRPAAGGTAASTPPMTPPATTHPSTGGAGS